MVLEVNGVEVIVLPFCVFNVTNAVIFNSPFAVGLNVPINGLDGLGVTLAPCHSTEVVRPSSKPSTSSSTVTRSSVKTFFSTEISIVGLSYTMIWAACKEMGLGVNRVPSGAFNITSALILNGPDFVGLNVPFN